MEQSSTAASSLSDASRGGRRGRGRPPKIYQRRGCVFGCFTAKQPRVLGTAGIGADATLQQTTEPARKRRGRPPKHKEPASKRRGRPPKHREPEPLAATGENVGPGNQGGGRGAEAARAGPADNMSEHDVSRCMARIRKPLDDDELVRQWVIQDYGNTTVERLECLGFPAAAPTC